MSAPDQDQMLKAYDENGNPIMVSKDEWKAEVLPVMIEEAGDDPNLLYGVITLATDNGMVKDILDAAQRAYELDAHAERASTMLAVVLFRANQIDRAEQVLADYLDTHGKSSMILSCMARVHFIRNEFEPMLDVLDQALKLDPNNEMALDWLVTYHGEKGDGAAAHKALEGVALIPGSWRAQTWMAHKAIEEKDKSQAVALYSEALKKSNYSQEAMTLAGMDLVAGGHIIEMIDLLEPDYDPDKHGVGPGWSLVQGYLHTGQKRRGILMLNKIDGIHPSQMNDAVVEARKELAKLPDEEV